MPKKLTELQKQEISKSFIKGTEIKRISEIYNFSTQTIIKQLKIIFGEEKYKNLKNINFEKNKNSKKKPQKNTTSKKNNDSLNKSLNNQLINSKKIDSCLSENSDKFFEIIPLNDVRDLDDRKDMATIPLLDFDLPQIVYMVVDKGIELEPKKLEEYPDWGFMPEEDLMRLTLEIFPDQKKAKYSCSNNQKLIKIPNSNVFLIVAEILKGKGISRIIYKDSLLSL